MTSYGRCGVGANLFCLSLSALSGAAMAHNNLADTVEGGPHLGELNASAQGGGGSRPVLKLGVAQQAGDEFVAKQTFISLFRNGMDAVFISL